ncbi:PPR_2 domain-containing protein, partial [Cephalotus follicularis]
SIEDALASFNRMLRMHPRLTSIVKFKHYAAVVSLCKQMESLGIKPNVYTLNISINCCCRLSQHHLHFGFSILGKMFKLGLQPTTVTFNTLINGLCIGHQLLQALRLSDHMVESGCKPDVFTYNTIVNGLCKTGNTDVAINLLRKMEGRGVEPDKVTYNAIID